MYTRNYLTRLLIILSIVIAASFLVSNESVADALAGPLPPVRPLSAAAAELMDARAYSADHKVNVREARRRLRAENQMSGVIDLLRRGAGKRYAGLWIEHEPKFRVMVRLTGKELPASGLKAALANSPIPVVFQNGAAASQADLLDKIHSALPIVMAALPDTAGTDVDVRTGEIVLTVFAVGAAREAALAKVPALASRLGAPVRIDFLDSPLVNQASVRGGANLTDCTSGFVVANSAGTRGFVTAGHCPSSETYSGFDGTVTSTTFQSETFDADQDFQWHTTPQTEVPEFYADLTTSARVLTGKRLRSSTAVGNTACHRGLTSGYSCGSVQSTTYQFTDPANCNGFTCSSTYISVTGSSLACAGGDSGGPWFNGQTAFGIHKAGPRTGPCTIAIYTSTDYLSGTGVSLVFGP
jgi:streptogrisin C